MYCYKIHAMYLLDVLYYFGLYFFINSIINIAYKYSTIIIYNALNPNSQLCLHTNIIILTLQTMLI